MPKIVLGSADASDSTFFRQRPYRCASPLAFFGCRIASHFVPVFISALRIVKSFQRDAIPIIPVEVGNGAPISFSVGSNARILGLHRFTQDASMCPAVLAPTSDLDVDAAGNIWVCDTGGAAKRHSTTGLWERRSVTTTSQYGFFGIPGSLRAIHRYQACAAGNKCLVLATRGVCWAHHVRQLSTRCRVRVRPHSSGGWRHPSQAAGRERLPRQLLCLPA